MTHIDKSSVAREVSSSFGAVIIRITPEGAYYREKGRRKEYGPVSWDFQFRRAVDLTVQRAADAKPRRKRSVSRGLLTVGR